jgi:uncharacterized protein YbjT (DUF2867 family)
MEVFKESIMILVTGGTGVIGRELVAQLLEDSTPFRILVRDPAKVAHLQGHADIVQGDLGKVATLAPAMAGVDHIFLLTVDQDTGSDANVIQAAKAAEVRHVVKISTNFVENERRGEVGTWHLEKEEYLKASGLKWTLLRPAAFSSNSLNWAGSIKARGAVFVSSGQSKGVPIDPFDIAAVAKRCLTRPGHEGQAYDMTGPELLTAREQVGILAKVLGRGIQVIDITVEEGIQNMARFRVMGPRLEKGMREMMTIIREGGYNRPVTDTVLKVTGRAPRSFKQWCEANKAAFLG